MMYSIEHSILEAAKLGDQNALNKVLTSIKSPVYQLCLKMQLFPSDAQDATQEVLIKVMRNLPKFRGDSQFSTWVYRIAMNHLITFQGKKSRHFEMPFEAYAQMIDEGQVASSQYAQNEGEKQLLEKEVMISCTQGLLLCLTPTNRLTYILGAILELSSKEGGAILGITPENFRQQLSRSKQKIAQFLNKKCGLFNQKNPCRCHRKIDLLVKKGLVNPSNLKFKSSNQPVEELFDQIDALEKSIAIYRALPEQPFPDKIFNKIKNMLYE